MTLLQSLIYGLFGFIGGEVLVTLLALIIRGPKVARDYLLGRL